MPRILAFAGSARKESLNKRLAIAATDFVKEAGGEVTLIDLRDFPMPLYDGDLEDSQGPPTATDELFALMKRHDGLLIACPEYNSSITPLLKNTIDWLSRPREGEAHMAAFQGKVAALLSASPGGLGGLRGLVHVRAILSSIGVVVIPNQVAAPSAHESFADDGSVSNQRLSTMLTGLAKDLVETTQKLHG